MSSLTAGILSFNKVQRLHACLRLSSSQLLTE